MRHVGPGPGPGRQIGRIMFSRKSAQTFVVLCQHCDDPECVGACIAGALTKDKDGTVRYHPELCVGCLMCIMACPFEAMYRDPAGKTVVKCDLCGGKETPSCVEACKVGALYLETEAAEECECWHTIT